MTSKPKPKSQHGGKRKNAGRPTVDEDGVAKRRSVTLPDRTVDKAVLLGDGNLSAGLRIAVNKVLPD